MAKAKKTTRKRTGRKIVQSKKMTIDGIQFQSQLEGKMYILLRDAGIKFGYESQSYNTLEGDTLKEECWERARRTSKAMIDRRKVTGVSYTPDFIGENEEWFIECKGRANESFPIRWKLFKNMVNSRKKPPIIFKPMNTADCEQVINILTEKGYGQK